MNTFSNQNDANIFNIAFHYVLPKYNYPHRYYHNFDHITNMLADYKDSNINVLLAIIFHDAIYDVTSTINEWESADYFKNVFIPYVKSENWKKCEYASELEIKDVHLDDIDISGIYQAIIDTHTHVPTPGNSISETLCNLDMRILYCGSFNELLTYENFIFKEYQRFDIADYVRGRVEFLSKYTSKNPNVGCLIDYIQNKTYNIGIYPGSFNPFHIGHLDILKRAERIFDKVIVFRGINPDKNEHITKCSMPMLISNRNIIESPGLTTDTMKEYLNIKTNYTVIRGIRASLDLEYESNYCFWLKEIKDSVNTIHILSQPEHEKISSSSLREMKRLGRDDLYNKYVIQ